MNLDSNPIVSKEDGDDSQDEYDEPGTFPSPAPVGFSEPSSIGNAQIDDLLIQLSGATLHVRVSYVSWIFLRQE